MSNALSNPRVNTLVLHIGPLIECAAAVGLDFFNYNTKEHAMREGFVILGVFCVLVGGILYFALYH